MTRTKSKHILFGSAFSFFAMDAIAKVNDLYRSGSWHWVDIPIHFMAGVMAAALFYWFFHKHPTYFDLRRSFSMTLVLVLGWVALVSVVWEFIEYTYDYLIMTHDLNLKILQLGVGDTMGDILAGLLGGLSLAIFIKLRYHR